MGNTFELRGGGVIEEIDEMPKFICIGNYDYILPENSK